MTVSGVVGPGSVSVEIRGSINVIVDVPDGIIVIVVIPTGDLFVAFDDPVIEIIRKT